MSLYDGQMNTSLRPLYSQLTGNGHLTKVIRFGVTVPYRRTLDYAVFQTIKVKFPLARYRATDAEIDELAKTIAQMQPCWVGLNVIAPHNQLARRITDRLHSLLEGVPVIWGGYMAINEPTWCLTEGRADAACIGEGEKVVLQVTDRIKAGQRDLRGIAGLWTRDTETGGIEKAERLPLLTARELEAIPMIFFERTEDEIHLPKDSLDHYANLPQCDGGKANSATVVHDILFTRGCFFRCTFCHHNAHILREKGQGTYYRPPSPEWVVEQCKDAKHRLGKHRFLIWDDIFPYDLDWVKRFAKLYKRDIALPFSVNFHLKLVFPEVIDILVDAGMDSGNLGIQSGSEGLRRDVLGRTETNALFLKTAEWLHKKIYVCYDLIIDNPFETEHSLREGFEFWLNMPHPYVLDTNTLLFFENQDITKRALAQGLIDAGDVLGRSEDAEYEDATCTPRRPRTDSRLRAWTMLIVACQNSFISREELRAWSRDEELLNDDRLMALKILEKLYFHSRERMFEYEWNMMEFYNQLHSNQPSH